MLKDAPILLLDEATSALDSGEAAIQESLDKMMENKTVIAVHTVFPRLQQWIVSLCWIKVILLNRNSQ